MQQISKNNQKNKYNQKKLKYMWTAQQAIKWEDKIIIKITKYIGWK